MTYRISKRAERNVAGIHAFISRDNPDSAADMIRKLVEIFERLTIYPKLGHSGWREGTREFAQPPYLIVYRVTRDAIIILNVRRGRQIYLP